MNDSRWGNDHIGKSEKLMSQEGCAVTVVAQVVSALTYSTVTPKDINECEEYFEGANIDFKALYNGFGFTYETLFGSRSDDISIDEIVASKQKSEIAMFGQATSTKESIITSIIQEQVEKEIDVVIVAQVAYSAKKDDKDVITGYNYHFVTLTGETLERDGQTYVYIKGTSVNDYDIRPDSMRGEVGWIKVGGRVAVPMSTIDRMDIIYRNEEKEFRTGIEIINDWRRSRAVNKAFAEHVNNTGKGKSKNA